MQNPVVSSAKAHDHALAFHQVWSTGSDPGFYGTRPLSPSERFCPKASCSFGYSSTPSSNGIAPTGPVALPFDVLTTLAPTAFIREVLAKASSPADPTAQGRQPTFTLLTPCVTDRVDFIRCATALASLASNHTTDRVFDWLVEYDGTVMDDGSLGDLIPPSINTLVSLRNIHRLPYRLPFRDAMREDALSHWIVHLPVTDGLWAGAFDALTHYIRTFVSCRCILSRRGGTGTWPVPADADRACGVGQLFDLGWDPDHTVVLRADLWNALCRDEAPNHTLDDYGIALRAALRTPVLLIPDCIAKRSDPTFSPTAPNHAADSSQIARRRFLYDLADKFDVSDRLLCQTDRPRVSRGLCILRTQGRNLELLTEAVQSIKDQTMPVTACVVVHGSRDLHADIVRWLGPDGVSVVVLSAWQKSRHRGYPLNVGLDYLQNHASEYDYFCFLDDDDVFYPFFAERLTTKLFMAEADFAYALTNQRVPWETAVPGHTAKPTSMLVAGNFIPINSYVARTSVLNAQKTRFRDDMGYLEDWDFLLQILGNGATIAHLPEVLSEYRIVNDGNVAQKLQQAHYDDCLDRVLALGQNVARDLGRTAFLRDLADFDTSRQQTLSDEEINLARVAWSMMCETDSDEA